MSYLILFATFFKIGLFTFGGGYAMLPLITEAVAENGWLTSEQLINFVAVSESTPGPFAVNIATYIGCETAGILGGICATLGVVLPSFIIILIVAQFFEKFKTNKVVAGCMSGLKPAVIGLIGAAAVSMGKTVFLPNGFELTSGFLISLGIFAVMAVLALNKKHPILIICLSAALGIIAGLSGLAY